MKKRVLSILSVAALLFSLTSCGSTSSQVSSSGTTSKSQSSSGTTKKNITLTVWSGFTSADGDVLNKIMAEFSTKTGIKLEHDIMPWDTFDEKLPTAIASGDAPDFVISPPPRYKNYASAKVLSDVSGFYSKYPDVASKIPDNIKNVYTWDGVKIGIPMQLQSYYYYWDKDMFKAAGLDPEKPPQTMEQVFEYAKLLTNKSKNQYGLIMPTNNQAGPLSVILSYGGDLTDSKEKTATFNSKNVFNAMTSLKNLWDNGYTPKSVDDNTYISGQCAQFFNSTWIISGLRKNGINFGVASIPAAKGFDKSTFFTCTGWSIPTTTSKDKYDSIYEWMAYWNSVDVSKRWYKEAGSPCYNTDAIASYSGDELKLLKVLTEPNAYGHLELTKTGAILTYADTLFPAVQEILIKNSNIQTTLDKFNTSLQKKLSK